MRAPPVTCIEDSMTFLTDPASSIPTSPGVDTVAEIGRLLSSASQIGDVYSQFAGLVGELIGFDRLSVSAIDSSTGLMEILYVDGIYLSDRDAGFGHPLNGTLAGSMIENGRVVAIDGATTISDWPGMDELKAAGLQSALVSSLMIEGDLVGVMMLAQKSPDGFAAKELAMAGQIASQISGSVAAEMRRDGIYRHLAA
jgi:transcriptional regulator with GAF, ATPase, and Fis domain